MLGSQPIVESSTPLSYGRRPCRLKVVKIFQGMSWNEKGLWRPIWLSDQPRRTHDFCRKYNKNVLWLLSRNLSLRHVLLIPKASLQKYRVEQMSPMTDVAEEEAEFPACVISGCQDDPNAWLLRVAMVTGCPPTFVFHVGATPELSCSPFRPFPGAVEIKRAARCARLFVTACLTA